MPSLASFLLGGAALLGGATAAVPEHLVTSLPGYDGALPSKHYSGYMPVGNTSGSPGMIHYWVIEAETNPETAPVVYWTNGGPGGSGISAGLLTEMGQLHPMVGDDGSVKLTHNEYSWSKVANMVYVSQPKGVGFSYCLDPNSCENDDKTSAEDAYDFFVAFFEAYPEWAKNDFYLTAESYGGIYLPTFMREIDTRGGVPNFKGAAIGDGCWGGEVGTCAFETGKSKQITVETFFGHSMISQTLYADIQAACKSFSNDDVKDKTCSSLLDQANTAAGTFDIYNIYDTCAGDTLTYEEKRTLAFSRKVAVTPDTPHSVSHPSLFGGALNDYPCGGDAAVDKWLAQPDVVAALHVKANNIGMNYTWGPSDFSGDLRPLYKELAQKYRMLIYSGDTDACVPTYGTEEWVRELGFPVTKDWRSWTSPLVYGGPEQRAGYVIDYDSGSTHFKFATVQGAGHLVPTYKPYFALTMITKFLNDAEF